MNEKQVIDLMTSATSESDWNAKCDQVQAACNGYPPFWFGAIIRSGLAAKVAESFGGSAGITITTK